MIQNRSPSRLSRRVREGFTTAPASLGTREGNDRSTVIQLLTAGPNAHLALQVTGMPSVSLRRTSSVCHIWSLSSNTMAQALCAQCAEKFEVTQPQEHRLFVLVDGRCFQLADEALPHRIKGYLLRSEPKRDFHFVYRPLDGGGDSGNPPFLVVREPNFL
ncbi:Hypothetical predicted protein [Marmota monax]|uniref:Ras-associating domain-containing protein n=1 Tax=Marmota monax TaxID=9995 RepID=A0A5E4AQF9_MARMO|nr:Hypothetical predicted protein [Marmota monax]